MVPLNKYLSEEGIENNCPLNCSSCENASVCTNCFSGYFLTNSSTC